MVFPVLAASLLSPNLGLAVWMLIAFGLFYFVLSKFAFPAMLGGLKEREETIEASMTRAERALAEAKQLQADNESARRDAERQAQSILAEARTEADRQREAAKTDLRTELAAERDRAAAEIDRQKQQALSELRAEVAALAVGAAEKILRKEIDATEQRGLVDQFIADLPQN
ncbi:F0F1 ATP synthase subunit B [Rubrivirga sp.]|uniref:F0F1 ATP synthase subunit B n=1 Tax=Rubrivirga sp. TaxID=1885344 RepID=UPI003B529A4F